MIFLTGRTPQDMNKYNNNSYNLKQKKQAKGFSNGAKKSPGAFITFEGPEGSGKTTHIRLLAEYLKRKGYSVELLIEPGSTEIGRKVREILLNPAFERMNCHCELFLYLAARCQLVEEKIKDLFKQGKVILCDRFNDATLAYQGYGAGIAVDFLINLTEGYLFTETMPDLTILLDVEPREGLRRAQADHPKDRQEKKGINFHKRVREGYLELAKKNPERIKVISSTSPVQEVQEKIRKLVNNVLE
jgi:dTMP kinase